MPQNLELKARILSMSDSFQAARNLNIHSKGILHQRDVYYNVPHGRLKLRIFNNVKGEMIYYNRPDKEGRRYSDYFIIPVSNPKTANEFFTAALGQKVVVDKRRHLFLYKNARIHLDNVQGLGSYIEFEVVVKYGKTQARILLEFLSKHFKIKRSDTIAVSYSDMVLRAEKTKIKKQL
jgi:predicted adenylyl cyclase CyaB